MWTCTCESEGNKICVTYEVWYMRCDSKLQVQSRWGLLNFEKLRSHKTRLPLAPLGLLFIWNVSPKWTQKMSVLTVTVNITWPKCGSNGLESRFFKSYPAQGLLFWWIQWPLGWWSCTPIPPGGLYWEDVEWGSHSLLQWTVSERLCQPKRSSAVMKHIMRLNTNFN